MSTLATLTSADRAKLRLVRIQARGNPLNGERLAKILAGNVLDALPEQHGCRLDDGSTAVCTVTETGGATRVNISVTSVDETIPDRDLVEEIAAELGVRDPSRPLRACIVTTPIPGLPMQSVHVTFLAED